MISKMNVCRLLIIPLQRLTIAGTKTDAAKASDAVGVIDLNSEQTEQEHHFCGSRLRDATI